MEDLPADLVDPCEGMGSILVRPDDGALVVGEVSEERGQGLSLFILELDGFTVSAVTEYPVGTVVGIPGVAQPVGEVTQMDWLPDGRIVFAAYGIERDVPGTLGVTMWSDVGQIQGDANAIAFNEAAGELLVSPGGPANPPALTGNLVRVAVDAGACFVVEAIPSVDWGAISGIAVSERLSPPPPSFLRGDCNADGSVDLADAVCMLNWLFGGADKPGCLAALNTNGDPEVDITDAAALLNFLFAGGAAPIGPFPDCGAGQLDADKALGCEKSGC